LVSDRIKLLSNSYRMTIPYRLLLPFFLSLLSLRPAAQNFYLRGGIAHQSLGSIDLLVKRIGPDAGYFPGNKLQGTMTVGMAGVGISALEGAFDAGLDLTAGVVQLTTLNLNTSAFVFMPCLSVDLYFGQWSSWYIGGGLQARYSRLSFSQLLDARYTGETAIRQEELNMRWGGAGYKIAAIAKHKFSDGTTSIRFSLGYALDERKLTALDVQGVPANWSPERYSSRFLTSGADLSIALMYSF